MVFSSTVFVFLFLPIVLGIYFILIRPGLRNLFLLAASLFFYAWGEKGFVLLMLASILANYALGRRISGAGKGPQGRKLLALAVVVNLGFLGLFKYSNFLADNLNVALELLGVTPIKLDPVHLPIGISFFTFQALSYVIDVYREDARAQYSVIKLGLYISLFPQLIAGPIVRYSHIAAQLGTRKFSTEHFAIGVRRFIVGLGKKMLIANTLGLQADRIFAIPGDQLPFGVAWLGVACYTLQIYFDFSGYSDMAIGLGRMFGFTFLENFNYPYVSRSVREFWRRWHISLSSWFRDYLFIPLGGSRGGRLRTVLNLWVVFFLTGFWHGASWNFIVWGLYHGSFLVLERGRFGGWLASLPSPFRYGYCLLVVMAGWVFFRAETLPDALRYLSAMTGIFGSTNGAHTVALYLNLEVMLALILGGLGALPIVPWFRAWSERLVATSSQRRGLLMLGCVEAASTTWLVLLLFGSVLALSAGTHNPFIYFRF